ncbi:hypothetical protein M422DRAFT_247339 [Sphaerobolus stellatus SS14]|nr:hypothetical protein M422DRAFT_247339 [Sphaerobolus stellatus SS14]
MGLCSGCGQKFHKLKKGLSCTCCVEKKKATSPAAHAEIDKKGQCQDCGVLYQFLKSSVCGLCEDDPDDDSKLSVSRIDTGEASDAQVAQHVLRDAALEREASCSSNRIKLKKLKKNDPNNNLQQMANAKEIKQLQNEVHGKTNSGTIYLDTLVLLHMAIAAKVTSDAFSLPLHKLSCPAFEWLNILLNKARDEYQKLYNKKQLPEILHKLPLPSFEVENVHLSIKPYSQPYISIDVELLLDETYLLSDLWE